MKWFNLFIILGLITLLTSTSVIAEPEKMTDEQMINVKVQEGIRNLDSTDNTRSENEILQNLATPIPGTGLEKNNNEPGSNMNQIELDNLNNQMNQQNIQEQFTEQLFDRVIENQ